MELPRREERDLWKHILQFRPSGLRVKRYANSPSLVAMTSTQIPILGPEQRHLTRAEGLRLQGFADDFCVPGSRTATFKALGNAVHVDVVYEIARRILRVEESNAGMRTKVPQLSVSARGGRMVAPESQLTIDIRPAVSVYATYRRLSYQAVVRHR